MVAPSTSTSTASSSPPPSSATSTADTSGDATSGGGAPAGESGIRRDTTAGSGSGSADGGGARTSDGGGAGGSAGTALPRTSPGAAGGIDETAYHDLLRRHIRDTLEYPPAVRRRGLAGTVELEISVRADGSIDDVTLVRSSSSRTLDDAAVGAVKQLPRVRFPSDLPPRTLRVLVPVRFDLR